MKPARFLTLAATVGCLTFATAAHAFDAKQQAKTVAPYLDDGTIAVGRLDLTKVDVPEIFKAVPRYLPVSEAEAASATKKVSEFLASMRAQKVSEAYVVVSLADVPRSTPFLIVPVGEGGSHKAVASLIFSGRPDGPSETPAEGRGRPFETCTQLNDVVFCGSRKTLARLKSQKPSPREHLAAAFEAVEKSAVQLAVIPSKDHHRVIKELMPRLPKAFGGFSGEELAKAVRFKAIGIDLPPNLKATVIVDSQNAAGAKKLKNALFNIAAMLGRNPEFKRLGVDLEQLAKLLNPTVKGNRLQLSFDADSEGGKKVLALFGGAIGQARTAARRATSTNNLKQFALAMHNFHDTYRSFPPVASFTKNDKKLLSWRVYLLPFVEGNELFKQFHLNEPWDSPHNKKLIAKMPKVFADPSDKVKKPGMTRYVAPVGKNHIFDGKPEGIQIRDITDGTSNTIMLVEAAPESAVVWTKPDDLSIDAKNPLKGLVGKEGKGFLAALADGSVRFFSKSIKLKTLRAMFTRNGGEVVDLRSEAKRRKRRKRLTSDPLKYMGLAMHNFHDANRNFPAVASFKKGKKLLSWRVYLLPYLDESELFKQFHLDEPWDSPHNKKLIAKMPKLFADRSGKIKKSGMTRFLAPVGKNHVFNGKAEGMRLQDITDGTSNTIMVVEASPENAVVWTKPDDLQVDDKNPLKGLVAKDGKGFSALFADGSVHFIPKSIKLKTLKLLFMRNDGQPVGKF